MNYAIFALLVVLIIPISSFAFGESMIPDWVKNNAKWWSVRVISQSEFINGLEFLINEGIIYVPPTDEYRLPGPDKIIPDWVRTTAGWWAINQIHDNDFINAIQYLIQIGLIQVNAVSPEQTIDEEIVQDDTQSVSEENDIKIHVLTEGYRTVTPSGKYILDVKVWDAEKYSGYDFGHRDYRLDNVSVQITLTNQEDEEIHSALGLTEYGMFRYDVMAKETTLDPALWKLKNTYNVKHLATLNPFFKKL